MSAKDDAVWKIDAPLLSLRQFYKAAALTGLTGNPSCMDKTTMEEIAAGIRGGKYFVDAAEALADLMIRRDGEAAKP